MQKSLHNDKGNFISTRKKTILRPQERLYQISLPPKTIEFPVP